VLAPDPVAGLKAAATQGRGLTHYKRPVVIAEGWLAPRRCGRGDGLGSITLASQLMTCRSGVAPGVILNL